MWHKSALGLEENLICRSSLREDQIRSTRLWYHDVVMIQLFIWYCTFEAQLLYMVRFLLIVFVEWIYFVDRSILHYLIRIGRK